MRLVFFGTSHGVPEPNRHCSCAMVECGEHRYFVDMGMMAMDELVSRGIAPDSVKGVFLTHLHGDHIDGLLQFVDLAGWFFKTVDAAILFPDERGIQALNGWFSTLGYPLRPMDFRIIQPGVTFDDGILRVTACRTQHCDVSYAFLLEELATGKKMLFTGDLRRPDVDFPTPLLEAHPDLIVCETAHFDASLYEPFFKGCGAKKIFFNHYGIQYGRSGVAPIQALAKTLDMPVVIASDGMEAVI